MFNILLGTTISKNKESSVDEDEHQMPIVIACTVGSSESFSGQHLTQ
jgi:hypothetical protein